MSLYKRYAVDRKKEQDGFWYEIPGVVNDDGTVPGFLLRRCGKRNTAWLKRFEEITSSKRPLMDAKLLSKSDTERLTQEAWAGTCGIGWRNVQGLDGQDVGAFSVPKLLKLLEDLPDLWDDLWIASLNGENYKPDLEKALEADGGN